MDSPSQLNERQANESRPSEEEKMSLSPENRDRNQHEVVLTDETGARDNLAAAETQGGVSGAAEQIDSTETATRRSSDKSSGTRGSEDSHSHSEDDEHSHEEDKEPPPEETGTAEEMSGAAKAYQERMKQKREKRLAMNRASAKERRRRKRVLIESLEQRVAELEDKIQTLEETNTGLRAYIGRLEIDLALAQQALAAGGPAGRATGVPVRHPAAPPFPPPQLPSAAAAQLPPGAEQVGRSMPTQARASVQRRADEVLASLFASQQPEASSPAGAGQSPTVGPNLLRTASASSAPPGGITGNALLDALAREEMMIDLQKQQRRTMLLQHLASSGNLPPPPSSGSAGAGASAGFDVSDLSPQEQALLAEELMRRGIPAGGNNASPDRLAAAGAPFPRGMQALREGFGQPPARRGPLSSPLGMPPPMPPPPSSSYGRGMDLNSQQFLQMMGRRPGDRSQQTRPPFPKRPRQG